MAKFKINVRRIAWHEAEVEANTLEDARENFMESWVNDPDYAPETEVDDTIDRIEVEEVAL